MKPFARLGHVCSVFLTIGIVSLSILTVVATMSLSHTLVAHADPAPCPNGYHSASQSLTQNPNSCLPNAAYYCLIPGQIWSPKDNSCISEASNTNTCNPAAHTKQDPDNAQQCIPDSQPCGSASTYVKLSDKLGYCMVPPPEQFP